MEFSGVFDITVNVNHDRIIIHEPIISLKYFLFIKFDNKIYIEIKRVGSIIIPFDELMKNKFLKMYYELSLSLVENKNEVIAQTGFCDNDSKITNIYRGRRNWCIDSAYFYENIAKNIKEVQKKRYYCYYDINPYTLFEADVATDSEIEDFHYNVIYLLFEADVSSNMAINAQDYNFLQRLKYLEANYNKLVISYINRVIEYNANMIENELDDMSAVHEDNLNLIKLIAFNENKYMNGNIFQIIYSNLLCKDRSATDTLYLDTLFNKVCPN